MASNQLSLVCCKETDDDDDVRTLCIEMREDNIEEIY